MEGQNERETIPLRKRKPWLIVLIDVLIVLELVAFIPEVVFVTWWLLSWLGILG